MENDFTFEINVTGPESRANFQGTLRRVNVILGANGSGKSSILHQIKGNPRHCGLPSDRVIYVEGGRVVAPPEEVALSRHTASFNTVERANHEYTQKRTGRITERVTAAFLYMSRLSESIKTKHSDDVHFWINNGSIGTPPARGKIPLDELFELFNLIIPEITLSLRGDNLKIECTKGGKTYSVSSMSDGEKQTLCLLADIAMLAGERSTIIVDEPELNLHPSLCIRLWDLIESRYSDCVFIYATHSIGFSLRSSIEAIFILSSDGARSLNLNELSNTPNSTLRDFLGAIPAILTFEKCVITEGNESSFDSIFYSWILDINSLLVQPLGGSKDVIGAAKGRGIWSSITTQANLLGVVDRDFKSEKAIEEHKSESVIILDYHEAESYLCHPDIIISIAQSLGTQENPPTRKQIEDVIIDFAEKNKFKTIINRIFDYLQYPLRPSIEKSMIRSIIDDTTLKSTVLKSCQNEIDKANSRYEKSKLEIFIDEEISLHENLIKNRDVDGIIKIFEGKELLRCLLRFADCRDFIRLVRAARTHLDISNFPHLEGLREELKSRIS